MTLGNNTIWLANSAVSVTTINYNTTVRRFFFEKMNFSINILRMLLDQILHYPMKIIAQVINQLRI
jgi:hypothetical protein